MLHPIFEAATACRQKFDRLQASEHYKRDVDFAIWLQRRYIDFNLWSHGSGSLAEGRYSLDSILHLRESLQSTLSNLIWILDSLLTNENHFLHPGQDLARQDVEDTLSDIVTLTATARSALPFSTIWTLDDADLSSSARKELEDFKEEMSQTHGSSADGKTLLNEPIPASRNRWSYSTAPAKSQQIHDRLIDANEKRRSRFVLARTKWEKTMQPEVANIATTWPPRSTFMLPAPPIVPASSMNFGCPYCYDSLPAYFAEAHAWREHIVADLAPYICLIPGCPEPLSFYATREKWLDHMLDDPHEHTNSQKSIRYWPCPLCEEKLDDNLSCIEHLEHNHNPELKGLGLTASAAAQLFVGPIVNMDIFATCPVCPLVGGFGEHYKHKLLTKPQGNSVDEREANEMAWKDFIDHVAWCLEVFSMKAMESSVNDNPVLPGTLLPKTVAELDASPLGVTVQPSLSIQEDFDPPLLDNTIVAVPFIVPPLPKGPSSMVTNIGSAEASSPESAPIRNLLPVQQTVSGIELYLKASTSYERLVSGLSVPQWHMEVAVQAIRVVTSTGIPVH